MKNKQLGFTLIELVVVIIILGILAATALPRFSDIQVRARIAKLNGALGAIKGASSLAHAQCLSDTNCTNATPSITMEGATIKFVNRYPAADVDGIVSAAGLSTINPVDYILTTPTTGTITIAVPGATTGTCELTYTNAAANAAPVIVFSNTTCI